MHDSRKIFLVSDAIIGVRCQYDPDDKTSIAEFKSLAQVKVDDYVMIETNTRHNMTVAKVVETDVDIDVESNKPCNWIIGVVDRSAFDKLKASELDAIAKIKNAEVRMKRRQLSEQLGLDQAAMAEMPANLLAGPSAEDKPDDETDIVDDRSPG